MPTGFFGGHGTFGEDAEDAGRDFLEAVQRESLF